MSGLWQSSLTAFMAMPKTPEDLNYLRVLLQVDVWCSWKLFFVRAETVAHTVQKAPNLKLWFRVTRPNSGHKITSGFCTYLVPWLIRKTNWKIPERFQKQIEYLWLSISGPR